MSTKHGHTMNNSSEVQVTNCTVVTDNQQTKLIKTAFYCLILLASLVANTLVVAIIYRKRRMRTTTNFFIANMAVSDLLFPIFAFPKEISEIFLGRMSWAVGGIIGNVLCKVISFLQDISTAVSIQSLVVIAVDRFYAVKFPLNPPVITARKSRWIIFLTWVTALSIHSPYFYTFRVISDKNQTLCKSTWEPAFDTENAQRLYAVIVMVSLTFIPVLLLLIFYSMIAGEIICQRIPGDQTNQERQRRQRENKRVLKQVVSVVVLFIVCIMPFTIFMFCLMFLPDLGIPCGFPERYFFATKFIVHANAALNPYIYFIFNRNYRQGFKEIVSGCRGISSQRREMKNTRLKNERKRIRVL